MNENEERPVGLDLEGESAPRTPPNFTTKFITTHKSEVRVAKFSPDGKFVVTGSEDTSIKFLDVLKMKNYTETKQESTEDFAPSKPMIRSFYDHEQVSTYSVIFVSHST
jgi:cleavage stimulation factor subunit 1